MSTSIDQKAYLQKYLTGRSGEKKKKKKKVVKGKGFKIIDDDIDLSKLRPLEGDELDFFGEGEDAPQIAGIIDERPEEVKKLEQFTTSKWRVINQDDGFTSKLQIEEIKKDVEEVQKENELIFGKMYSDSEDEQKKDSDPSPARKQPSNTDRQKPVRKKADNNSDSDVSPPRKNQRELPQTTVKQEKNNDSDLSPPRKHEKESHRSKERVRKPSRWGSDKETYNRGSVSPKRSRDNDSDASPPRKPRNSSPHRSKKKNYDSDASPPRKKMNKYGETSQKRPKTPDSDPSPPRKYRTQTSPASRRQKESSNRKKNDSDSDLSPPRKGREPRMNDRSKQTSSSPPPSNAKMASRTLDGKQAGLQQAQQLREENEARRHREEEAFRRMDDQVTGRNAQLVSRRSKRETSEEKQKKKEKAERQKELDEKYKKWSKGLKQIQDQEARVQDFIHEASKPFARHKDDKDLEHSLKQIERDGDPMLQYMRQRKREKGELGPERPIYKGAFPPNRFNIRPGHRWDGVDRSNGYETKYFTQQSKRKALDDEAYKWSTEDL